MRAMPSRVSLKNDHPVCEKQVEGTGDLVLEGKSRDQSWGQAFPKVCSCAAVDARRLQSEKPGKVLRDKARCWVVCMTDRDTRRR